MIRARNLPFAATVLIFVAAYALCAVQFPTMLSWRVGGNLLTDNAFLGIAAVGMTFLILSGGIDLSVASIIATLPGGRERPTRKLVAESATTPPRETARSSVSRSPSASA